MLNKMFPPVEDLIRYWEQFCSSRYTEWIRREWASWMFSACSLHLWWYQLGLWPVLEIVVFAPMWEVGASLAFPVWLWRIVSLPGCESGVEQRLPGWWAGSWFDGETGVLSPFQLIILHMSFLCMYTISSNHLSSSLPPFIFHLVDDNIPSLLNHLH